MLCDDLTEPSLEQLLYRAIDLSVESYALARSNGTPYSISGYNEFKNTSGFATLQDKLFKAAGFSWDHWSKAEQLDISRFLDQYTQLGNWLTVQDVKAFFKQAAHTAVSPPISSLDTSLTAILLHSDLKWNRQPL